MTVADYIRQMSNDELVDLLVWQSFRWLESVPDCSDDCEDFCGGCANTCPRERREEAVRSWLNEEI